MIPLNDLTNIRNFLNINEPRECQSSCFRTLLKYDKAIASMITGSGKSFIEYALVNHSFVTNSRNVNCIVTDSIMLGQQIAIDYIDHKYNDDINIILYNSDGLSKKSLFYNWLLDNHDIDNSKYKKLTDEEANVYIEEYETFLIEEEEIVKLQNERIDNINNIKSTLNLNDIPSDKKVLIVSTYQSFHKLKDLEFGTVVFDEAHRTNTDEFHSGLKLINSDKQYFFTSTPKGNLEKNSGMLNESIYGKIEYELKYEEAVNANIIVPFSLTTLINEEFDEDYKNLKGIDAAYKFSKKVIETELLRIKNKKTRTIINLDNIKQSVNAYENLKRDNLQINLYLVTSGNYFKYDHITKKEYIFNNKIEVLEESKLDTSNFCLINIKMLNVGIDMPALTTLGVFSASNSIRLLQSIGRILRVDKLDKNKQTSWKLSELNHNMEKPFGLVYINESGNNREHNRSVLKKSISFLSSAFGSMLHFLDPINNGSKKENIFPNDPKQILSLNSEYTSDLEQIIIGLNIEEQRRNQQILINSTNDNFLKFYNI